MSGLLLSRTLSLLNSLVEWEGITGIMHYRVAMRESHSATWRWRSPLLRSLHDVLNILNLYRALPEERIRVFLFVSEVTPPQMDAMLKRANQGELTTAITLRELWDARRTNWMEVRRLEIELGEGGDHDQPYDGNLICGHFHTLVWTVLLARRARGELLS